MGLLQKAENNFIDKCAAMMAEAIKECMACKFHVDVNDVNENFGSSEIYHQEMTFVESHETTLGTLEVFHYFNKQCSHQIMFMEINRFSFRVNHLLETAKSNTLPPILNFKAINSIGRNFFKGVLPLEQIVMSKVEYKALMPFDKEFHYSKCQTYRFRVVKLLEGYKSVFLSDSRIHDTPDNN